VKLNDGLFSGFSALSLHDVEEREPARDNERTIIVKDCLNRRELDFIVG
jgi:hypothetical protein